MVEQLRADTTRESNNVKVGSAPQRRPHSLTQYLDMLASFDERMQVYRQHIEELEYHLALLATAAVTL